MVVSNLGFNYWHGHVFIFQSPHPYQFWDLLHLLSSCLEEQSIHNRNLNTILLLKVRLKNALSWHAATYLTYQKFCRLQHTLTHFVLKSGWYPFDNRMQFFVLHIPCTINQNQFTDFCKSFQTCLGSYSFLMQVSQNL